MYPCVMIISCPHILGPTTILQFDVLLFESRSVERVHVLLDEVAHIIESQVSRAKQLWTTTKPLKQSLLILTRKSWLLFVLSREW